ncbi:MAG: isochorismatase family protein [Alphaproteobacteria bacterium]|nr:isochorismatase family protein [Alphaproteobacteria bacterium]
MLLEADRSQLLIVDEQERLMAAMQGAEAALAASLRLIAAARRLGMPITASEQYPKGLGPTVAAVAATLPNDARLAKLHFAVTADAGLMGRLAGFARPQVVIAGVEAHVCVLQTAIALKRRGYQPAVVWDAVASRAAESKELARDRLLANGVELVNSEMVVFEWLGAAGTPEFKDLSALVR